MTVPLSPEMAAKTSLFQVCKNAKCATSSKDKQAVMAMANFTPKTSFSLGSSLTNLPR
jgi:hypothetical protein